VNLFFESADCTISLTASNGRALLTLEGRLTIALS
jgi:hypothetical protein